MPGGTRSVLRSVLPLRYAIIAALAGILFGGTGYLLLRDPRHFLVGFLVFSTCSVASEAFFTGISNQIRLRRKGLPIDWKLPCVSFLWSIFVYGWSAAVSYSLVETLAPQVFAFLWIARGFLYMFGIYFWEYYWGWVIELMTGTCPWKYKESPWAIWRYINPYFAWSWFLFGFILEWIQLTLLPAIETAL